MFCDCVYFSGKLSVLHMVNNYPISNEDHQLFIFPDGCIVFWNCEDVQKKNILKLADASRLGSKVESTIVEEESEDLSYSYSS